MTRKQLSTAIIAAILCISGTVLATCPSADSTGDCRVDLADFAVLAAQWMTEGPSEPNIIWVSINDPGVGSGREGFTGKMSRYEITNAQYCQYLNTALASSEITVYENVVYAASDMGHSEPYFVTYAASVESPITWSGGTFTIRSRDGYSMANHPVVMVSWYGAKAFCDYYGCRLPTEWEWQAVADYDGSYLYGCGTTITKSNANYVENGYANPLGLTTFPYTSPVDYYPAYGYGMCNMAGNVWEWTSTVAGSGCIIRGGSWNNINTFCTVSDRYDHTLDFTYSSLGFRVCR